MKRLWLLFAQTVAVLSAIFWMLSLYNSDLLNFIRPSVLTIREAVGRSNATLPLMRFADAAEKALPSVVNVSSIQNLPSISRHPLFSDPFFRQFWGEDEQASPLTSLGSGVIISQDGYIITNNHVVSHAAQVSVSLLDGRSFQAKVVGRDADTDLAILKVNAKNLPAITLNSGTGPRIGDIVLAIGNPFAVGQTVTMGIVSALGRSRLGLNVFENFIQTDAPINPGNSGGALINTQGNLIGINTAIYSRSGSSTGIGFSIPAVVVQDVLKQVIAHGEVIRGWVGVETRAVTSELSAALNLPVDKGSLVSGIVRGGPAEAAGIKAGDLIVKINEKDIKDPTEMLNMIAALKPKDNAIITLYRGADKKVLTVKIGQRPAAKT